MVVLDCDYTTILDRVAEEKKAKQKGKGKKQECTRADENFVDGIRGKSDIHVNTLQTTLFSRRTAGSAARHMHLEWNIKDAR